MADAAAVDGPAYTASASQAVPVSGVMHEAVHRDAFDQVAFRFGLIIGGES